MKITVQFESLEEFQKFIVAADQLEDEKKAKAEKKQLTAEELNKGAQKTADIINAAEEKMEAEKKAEKKAKKEEPKDYDALRVECRKVLAELNKVTGKNTASEMIKSHGAEKLTQVEDEFLEELLAEAREALSNAK